VKKNLVAKYKVDVAVRARGGESPDYGVRVIGVNPGSI